jgi:hypothetical protein
VKPLNLSILDHLRRAGDISGIEAAALYRCRDLPKRISELREEGLVILREMKQDPTGQRYARYRLAPACAS